MQNEKDIQSIKQLLDVAENNIRQAKSLLFASSLSQKAQSLSSDSGNIIEGFFDGESMIGPNEKKFPVPANYASKSKLLPGDLLKLTILADGTFVFKQIGPVKRKKLMGTLEELEDNRFIVKTSVGVFRLLLASVSYFKAKNGDKLTVLIPEDQKSEWAALENIILE
jgi:hypothetical protein